MPRLNKSSRLVSRYKSALLALIVLGWGSLASAQEEASEKFTADSLKLRTALHYDSMLGSPLQSLVRLYKEDKREAELLGLYQAHTARYPEDAGAKVVLVRLLRAL
ncbi:MAG: hypothetical protein AAF226_17160, partial [Verrucomicrobiota bacterium]